jgi:hypothetical protein
MTISSEERDIKLPLLRPVTSPVHTTGSYSLEISQSEQGSVINVVNSQAK